MLGGQQRAVEQLEDGLVVGGQRRQRLQRVADFAGQHGGFQALAADIPEHNQRLAIGSGRGVDVVEVAADHFVVFRGPVAAGELDAVDRAQLGRQQVTHQRAGDRRLLGVEPCGRQRRTGAGREQPRQHLFALAEHAFLSVPQQHQRTRRDAVARQGSDHH